MSLANNFLQLIYNHYAITHRKLGAGGQGSVYLSLDRSAMKQLACKIVNIKHPETHRLCQPNEHGRSQLLRREDILEKLFREFKVLEHLSHASLALETDDANQI
jgi:serine/threonine protein kinase